MKNMTFLRIVILGLLLMAGDLFSQSSPAFSTSMMGLQTSSTTAHIRWSPNNFDTWKKGIQNGYLLTRYTIKQNGVLLDTTAKEASKVTKTFLPLNSAQWDALMDADSMAGVAGSAMFGERFTTQTDTATLAAKTSSLAAEKDNRFGLSLFAADRSLTAATAMGLYYKDTTLSANTIYLYISKPINSNLLHGFCYVNTAEPFQALPPTELKRESQDSSVIISWREPEDMPYLGYFVERSSDNGTTYTQLNAQPIVPTGDNTNLNNKRAYYTDLVANEVNYVYRIRAKTIVETFSPYSDTIHGWGTPPPIPFQLRIDSIVEVQPKVMKLFWTLPDSLNAKINGFKVERSNGVIDGQYQKLNNVLLPSSQRYFLDSNPFYSNYYRISTTDMYGHVHTSFEALGQPADSVPPAPPTGLVGGAKSPKSQTIKLHWNRNTEPDARGYRVYSSNLFDGEYTQLTSSYVTDTTFEFDINLNTISRYIFVRVLALDFRENHSQMCTAIPIMIPDIIAPDAASILLANPKSRSIEIAWARSVARDLKQTDLQRMCKYDASWVNVATFASNANPTMPYNDSTVQYRTNYKYRVRSVDSSDLVSYSNVVDVRGLGINVPTIDVLKATYYNKAIRLTWLYQDIPDVQDFLIYRSLGTPAPNSPTQNISNQEKLIRSVNALSAKVAKMENPYASTPAQGAAPLAQYLTMDETLSEYKGGINYRVIARFKDGTLSDFSNLIYVSKQ